MHRKLLIQYLLYYTVTWLLKLSLYNWTVKKEMIHISLIILICKSCHVFQYTILLVLVLMAEIVAIAISFIYKGKV